MKTVLSIIVLAIIAYFPLEYYFIWLPKHKKEMKEFNEKLFGKDNSNK